MCTHSTLSAAQDDGQRPDEDGLSAKPALAAASFAWLVASARLLIGSARGERFHLELGIAISASVVIPAIAFHFWLRIRPNPRKDVARIEASKQRPHLRLVSSAKPCSGIEPTRPSLATTGRSRTGSSEPSLLFSSRSD